MNTALDLYPYSSTAPTWDQSLVIPAVQRFLAAGSGNLLDLGCGNGSLLASLDLHGYSVFGADFSPSGIAAAKTREIGDFRVLDATNDLAAEYGAEFFDALISVEVIEHVYDPAAVLQSCYCLLKSGGRILLTTPYNGWLKNVALAMTNKFDRHLDPLWRAGHIKFWSRSTLTKALKEAGFSNVTFEGVGRAPFLWKSMILMAQKR